MTRTNLAIVPAAAKQSATIIFLHGLGDIGESWAEILPHLRPAHAKIVCPTAPFRNVAIHGDNKMRSWFNLRPPNQPRDIEGLQNASKEVIKLIDNEVNAGIPLNRIILGGFSQGGALALFTGLAAPYKVGGVLALSTWLPVDKSTSWDTLQKPRILQCQGDQDELVPLPSAARTAKFLKEHIPDYEFRTYKGLDHSIGSEQEQKDIQQFFNNVLPPLSTTDNIAHKSKL